MDQEARDAFKMAVRARMQMMTLKGMAEHMRKLEAEKAKLDEKLADVNVEYDILRMEVIPEKMDAEGIDKITYDGIGRIQLTADILCGQIAERKGEFFGWLDAHGFGDVVQPNINPSTLKAFIKARLKDGKLDAKTMQDFVRVTPITRASIVKG